MVSLTPVRKRRRFLRNVRVRLECGHEYVLPSACFRLLPGRVRALISEAVREQQIFCPHCPGTPPGHPRAFVRTERGAEG